MTDNASLDEFADAVEREQAVDSTDSPDSTDSGESADSPGSTDSADSSVEPASPTYVCSTDETACSNCGDVTTRRWRDGDALVCASCKEW